MWRDKDGKIYTRGGIVVGNMWYSNPTREQFIAAGWTWEEPVPPPPAPENSKFAEVKAAFWGYVDAAAEALSEATGQTFSRADFPAGAYSTELLAWCAEHGMTEAQTGALALKFCGIDADLRRLERGWDELFDEEVPSE